MTSSFNDAKSASNATAMDIKDADPPHLVVPLSPMIAPLRFGIVAQVPGTLSNLAFSSQQQNVHCSSYQSVYKGSFPRQRHLQFLSHLNLKTILSLTPKSISAVDEGLMKWCEERRITVHHIRCDKPKDDGGGISKENATKALLTLLDKRNLPLYIHCLDGQSVSTLLVAVLRKVQAWSMSAIQDEMVRTLGHDEEIINYQLSFVEKIGKPDGIRLPPRRFLPEWTWQSPSPLHRLKNPYDVIITRDKSNDKLNLQEGFIKKDSLANGSHKRQVSTDGASSVSSSNAGSNAQQYGVGRLPVQHPTLKLTFDSDPDLPPPPSSTATPLLGHSRDNSTLLSPSPSRPASRAGRTYNHHIHAHPLQSGHNQTDAPSRGNSRPGSPRRRVLTSEMFNSANSTLASDNFRTVQDVRSESGRASPERQSALHSDSTATGTTTSSASSSPRSQTDITLTPGKSNVPSTFDHRSHTSASDYLHQPQHHSHLNDVFSAEMNNSLSDQTPTKTYLGSQSVTPRASVSHIGPVRPQNVRGPFTGLGLQPEEAFGHHQPISKINESDVQIRAPSSSPSVHPAFHRSVSEQYTGSPRIGMQNLQSEGSEQASGNIAEYYSDPESVGGGHSDVEGEADKNRKYGHSRRTSDQSKDGRYSDQETEGRIEDGEDEEEEEEEESEEEEEEEEEEIDEEEDSDDNADEDDNLAIEALDLEGY